MINTPQSAELGVLPGDRLGKSAVNIQSNDPHAHSSVSRSFEREPVGQHDTY